MSINAPPVAELLKVLQGDRFNAGEKNTLILISMDSLPEATDETYWADLAEIFATFKTTFNAQVFQISRVEYGILLSVTEQNQINVNTSLKYDLLRLIQRSFPEFFSMVDQNRLIRYLDLRLRLKNAMAYLEHKMNEMSTAKPGSTALRNLREQDIDRVREVLKSIGPEAFVKLFVKSQPIIAMKKDAEPQVVMHEYFVAMEQLRRHAFPEVQLRGSGNVFNQLTVELDTILMTLFKVFAAKNTKASLNLNVESVFTSTFHKFQKSFGDDGFNNLVFEFRQPDILQHFDQFEVAATTIYEKQGNIAVDAIHLETIGVMNLSRVGASMAKIFWQPGAENSLPDLKEEIDYMAGKGRILIMSRIDEEVAITTSQALGINMFQGFLVDDMINPSKPKEG
jgi:hypothetical protein